MRVDHVRARLPHEPVQARESDGVHRVRCVGRAQIDGLRAVALEGLDEGLQVGTAPHARIGEVHRHAGLLQEEVRQLFHEPERPVLPGLDDQEHAPRTARG